MPHVAILDSTSVTATEIWSRWCDWLDADTNIGKWLPAIRQVGGDDLVGGLSIPPYILSAQRLARAPDGVEPQPHHHGQPVRGRGGVPVVQTPGTYQVNVSYTVPVQAQGISTSGCSGPSASDIADEVMAWLAATTIPVDVRKINAVDRVWRWRRGQRVGSG